MEFKLNKIDTDVRKRMQEDIKEEKVHSGKGINIKKDIKDEKYENLESQTGEEHDKRYITIDGIKSSNIDIEAEKVEKISGDNSKGRVLDTMK